MPRKPAIPYEDKVAQAAWDAIESDARGMAAMMGPLPDTTVRSREQDLTDWMFLRPGVDVAELQQGVALNEITPQMAAAIQEAVQEGWLDQEEISTLTPKDAGMLAMHPRRLPLMRTGRPDPEMQIRYSDQMEALKRKKLEEQAVPMGVMDGGSVEAGPAIESSPEGSAMALPSLLAEGGVPQPEPGGTLSPETQPPYG